MGFVQIVPINSRGTEVFDVQCDGFGGPWTLAGSPYIVVGNVLVPVGTTLTIEPGVEVKFDGYYKITVDGTLYAVGNETGRINITSNKASPAPDDWDQIRITPNNNIVLKYCDIRYCKWGVYLDQTGGKTIVNNTFSSSYIVGMYLYKSSGNKILNNTFASNQKGALFLFQSSNNKITNNTFSGNIVEAGLNLYDSCSGNTVLYNTFSGNQEGLRLESSSNNRIYYNNFINNGNSAWDDKNTNYWDNGYPNGGNYWSDYGGSDNKKGPNQDIPGSDGIGDTPYNLKGGAGEKDFFPLWSPSSYEQYKEYSFLKPGWNLISIPIIQSNTSSSSVLRSIQGEYDSIQWYDVTDSGDPWKHNSQSKPSSLNDLSEINHKIGLWIHITTLNDTIFLYDGTEITQNQKITLYPGWNLVGYPSKSNKTRTSALNNINFGSDVDSIWTYDAGTYEWHELGPSDYFRLGKGYWIHSKVTKVWDVPI